MELHRAIKSGGINELVEKGGRGSTKSSFISLEVILLLLKHPDCPAVIMRKVGNTLRSSVYAQLQAGTAGEPQTIPTSPLSSARMV
ncbi:MAG: phage terminase large subunit [Lawsonibacter sp.]|nr:phage terminase large subunit [Lawsonibacter sp.]